MGESEGGGEKDVIAIRKVARAGKSLSPRVLEQRLPLARLIWYLRMYAKMA
jgi:hypothetical protein